MKDLLYEVYLEAGAPSLDEIAREIATDDHSPGAPSRDTVRRCISEASLPPSQADVTAVAAVLARQARWDAQDVVGRVRGLWVEARLATGAGRPVGEFDDRLVLSDLEVRPAFDAGGARERLGSLPVYVRREFDHLLRDVIAAAEAGQSGIAVLVGESSTGKTRALWEAVRKLPVGWRVWHPLSPTRPDATLAELSDLAPRTVVWLNEAQLYLGPEPLGEQVAAGLRTLLHDATRGPILVLATLWPDHWCTLTARSSPDWHSQARQLLEGHDIAVPAAFTATDLAALSDVADADPRLAEAAERSQGSQVTQYLAGVPVLLNRFHNAQGATRALIHAAMDARRLGAGPHLPLSWLDAAAPGYLTAAEWSATNRDWLTQALDYVTQDCNGIPGILTQVKATEPRNQRPHPATPPSLHPLHAQGPLYQLTDYLDQYGRLHRANEVPPIDFWTAASAHARPTDLGALGTSAWNYGLYRDASQLHKQAIAHGSPDAAASLVSHFRRLQPADPRPAFWAVTHVPLSNPSAVARLLDALRKAAAKRQTAALLARDPASHVTLDNPSAIAWLLGALRKARARKQVTILAARVTEHVVLEEPTAAASLLSALRKAKATEQAAALVGRTVGNVDPSTAASLIGPLQKVGANDQVTALSARAAAQVALNDPSVVAPLLDALHKVGSKEQVTALVDRDPAGQVVLDNAMAVAWLLRAFYRVGAAEQTSRLLARDPASHASLDNPTAVSDLLDALRTSGATDQVDAVVARDPAAHAPLNNPSAVARLLDALRMTEATEQIAALLARDPSTHVSLNNPDAVSDLLGALHRVGAAEQADTLLARDPATHTSLSNLQAATRLLNAFERAEATAQVSILAERLSAARSEAKFAVGDHQSGRGRGEIGNAGALGQVGLAFGFGREPDGSPAAGWSWDDLA
ncbi:hypothetical protein ACFWZJ_27100 [Streptomyces massasporeus]